MSSKIEFYTDGNYLKVCFFGEIDTLSLSNYRDLLINKVNDYKIVVFDFKEVSFVDSSGIGLVLVRYNQIKDNGGTLYLMNLNKVAYHLFELTGIFSLMEYIEDDKNIYTKVGISNDTNGD